MALARPAGPAQTDKDVRISTRNTESSQTETRSLTEISQFELPLLIDEEVLRLQVSVQNFPPVAIRQTSQNLEEEDLKREGSDEVTLHVKARRSSW